MKVSSASCSHALDIVVEQRGVYDDEASMTLRARACFSALGSSAIGPRVDSLFFSLELSVSPSISPISLLLSPSPPGAECRGCACDCGAPSCTSSPWRTTHGGYRRRAAGVAALYAPRSPGRRMDVGSYEEAVGDAEKDGEQPSGCSKMGSGE